MSINEDLDAITSILYQTFELTPFKRDYDTAFRKIANILSRSGVAEKEFTFPIYLVYARVF
jgi:hypothetical protein